MKLPGIAVAIMLAFTAESAGAYSITTYQGVGGSHVEACTLAKQTALAPSHHATHGRIIKTGACECKLNDRAGGGPQQWRCLVQVTRAN